MANSTTNKKLTFFICILVAGSFLLGLYFGKSDTFTSGDSARLVNRDASETRDINFSVFWEVWDLLDKEFVNQPVLDEGRFYGAIKGMVESLGDPYTVFLTPDETKRFQDDLNGSFQGIGIEIGIRDNLLTVISPIDNSPAKRAGVLAGDIILEIDDLETTDLTLDEAVEKIRGERGTAVTLTIFREETEETTDIEITRDDIEVVSVKVDIIDDVAHLQISRFGETTEEELGNAIRELQDQGADKIVLDLRNNPGGFLQTSIEVASRFIESGVIAVQEFGDGEQKVFDQEGDATLASYPLVVLVNEGSASASEIVAGALRDQRGVNLIGMKTFGKGSVQEVELLSDGSSVRITVAKWLTPNGTNLNENGLDPDIEVDLTQEDINAGEDPQLDRALEFLDTL